MHFYDLKKLEALSIDEQIAIKKKIINENDLNYIPTAYLPEVVTDGYFFVSYSHLDYKLVYSDVFDLEQEGLSIWYDRGIPAGKNWKDIAVKYMAPFSCKGILFYISKNALASNAIRDELQYALDLKKPFAVVLISPDGKKPVELAEELLNQDLIDKERFEFFQKALTHDNLYLDIKTPSFTKKEKIDLNIAKQKLLDAEMNYESFKGYKTPGPHSFLTNLVNKIAASPNPPRTIYGSFRPGLIINGLKDYYAREILIKDYVDLLDNKETIDLYKRTKKMSKEEAADLFGGTEIATVAFANSKNIEYVEMPSIKTIIKENAFRSCDSLKQVVFIGSKHRSAGVTIEQNAFAECYQLEKFDFDNTKIGAGAFRNCTKLVEIDLSKSLSKAIEKDSFKGCTSLSAISFPEVAKTIGKNSFEGTAVKTLEFSRMIESIDEYAFANCRMLEKVVFGEGIRRIAKNAFSRCARLKEVHFNLDYKSVKDLNSIRGCLNKCYNLESIFFNRTSDELINQSNARFADLFSYHHNCIRIFCTDKIISIPPKLPNYYDDEFRSPFKEKLSISPEGKISMSREISGVDVEEFDQAERYDQVVKEMEEDKELVSKFKKYDA